LIFKIRGLSRFKPRRGRSPCGKEWYSNRIFEIDLTAGAGAPAGRRSILFRCSVWFSVVFTGDLIVMSINKLLV